MIATDYIFGRKNIISGPAPFTLTIGNTMPTTTEIYWTTPPEILNTGFAYKESDLFVDGVLHQTKVKNEQSVGKFGIATTHTVQLQAVDVWGQKGDFSNIVEFTTLPYNGIFDLPTITNYYKGDGLAVTKIKDYVGGNDGVDINLIRNIDAKVGKGFRSTSDGARYMTVGNLTGMALLDRSVNFWVRRTDVHTPTTAINTGVFFVGGSATHYPWTDGKMYIGSLHTSRATISGGIADRTQWHMVTVTKDSAGLWKFHQNGNLIFSQAGIGTAASSSATFGVSNPGNYNSNAEFCEISFHSKALTQTEIDFYYNAGNGRTLDF